MSFNRSNTRAQGAPNLKPALSFGFGALLGRISGLDLHAIYGGLPPSPAATNAFAVFLLHRLLAEFIQQLYSCHGKSPDVYISRLAAVDAEPRSLDPSVPGIALLLLGHDGK